MLSTHTSKEPNDPIFSLKPFLHPTKIPSYFVEITKSWTNFDLKTAVKQSNIS